RIPNYESRLYPRIEIERRRHRFVESFLLFGFRFRGVDLEGDDLIAGLLARPSAAAQAHLSATVRTRRHPQFHFASQGRHGDRCAQRSFPRRDGDDAVDVAPFQAETRILAHADFQQEIARRAALHAGIALPAQADLPPRLDAGRNLYFKRAFALYGIAQGDALSPAGKG